MLTPQKLSIRAKKALYNIDEIDDEFITRAIADANEECSGKDVKEYIKEDFAYIRLKIYLKIDLNDEDELLYKEALKAIKNASYIDEATGETSSSSFYKVKNREFKL